MMMGILSFTARFIIECYQRVFGQEANLEHTLEKNFQGRQSQFPF